MEGFVKFHNPLKTDYVFRWDNVPYMVKAGETVELAPHLAKHGAKHLVDYIILHPETWSGICPERSSQDLGSGRNELTEIVLLTGSTPVEQKLAEVVKEEIKKEQPKPVEEFADLDQMK